MASFVKSTGFKYAKNFVFGVGAAVVIIGAWGKLTHQPWANFALTLGLLTEAVLFTISGLLPPEKDYYWEKLYPGLDNPEGAVQGAQVAVTAKAPAGSGSTAALDKMLDEAKIDQASINRLGDNLKKLSENVSSLANVANAQIATEQFAAQAKLATEALAAQTKHTTEAMSALSKNVDNLSKVYGNMLTAMRS